MDAIFQLLNSFQLYIIIALCVVSVILFIILLVVLRSLSNVEKKYRKLMRGVNNKNLEELIVTYLDKVDGAVKLTEDLKDNYNELTNKLNSCFQKFSMIRYRAFDDVGSDLSYSIALLDVNNNGVILTGLYGRNESTTYAKPIDKGISRYDLSEEEEQVLNDAMEKEIKK